MAGKHARKWSFSRWCRAHVWGTWTQNKMLSRKWLLAAGVVVVGIALDIAGHPLGETTTRIVEIVVPAFLLVEGALDWRNMRKAKAKVKPEPPSEAAESEEI